MAVTQRVQPAADLADTPGRLVASARVAAGPELAAGAARMAAVGARADLDTGRDGRRRMRRTTRRDVAGARPRTS